MLSVSLYYIIRSCNYSPGFIDRVIPSHEPFHCAGAVHLSASHNIIWDNMSLGTNNTFTFAEFTSLRENFAAFTTRRCWLKDANVFHVVFLEPTNTLNPEDLVQNVNETVNCWTLLYYIMDNVCVIISVLAGSTIKDAFI